MGTLMGVKNLTKIFHQTKEGKGSQVLKDMNFSVDGNEFVVVLEPGQYGKAALPNIITGLEEASSGEIYIWGKRTEKPGPDRAMVFQNVLLFPWLALMGDVGYSMRVRGADKKERRAEVQKYIDLVGLNGFGTVYPIRMSGGMRQRVGITRAYCTRPDVILMDESLGALDTQTGYLMQDEAIRIRNTEKQAVIFVTNNIEEALYLTDRIVVMTTCPSTVLADIRIQLPRPRNYINPEFSKLRKKISAMVSRKRQDMGKESIKVQAGNLTKCLGDLKVLGHISFDVGRGEFLYVAGPTGYGRTTLPDYLTKIYDITDGEILVDKAPIDCRKNNISYILQESSAMEWLTVKKNIRFGLQIKRAPQALLKERVEEMLEIVGLTKYRHYYPRQLSISMLQRTAIARAFATYPELLLMDKPYGRLDLDLRFKLGDGLLKLWQRAKTAVIFITHNMEEAVYLGERIVIFTNEPTGVEQALNYHLGRPRNVANREFVKIRNEVTDLIRWW